MEGDIYFYLFVVGIVAIGILEGILERRRNAQIAGRETLLKQHRDRSLADFYRSGGLPDQQPDGLDLTDEELNDPSWLHSSTKRIYRLIDDADRLWAVIAICLSVPLLGPIFCLPYYHRRLSQWKALASRVPALVTAEALPLEDAESFARGRRRLCVAIWVGWISLLAGGILIGWAISP